MHIPPPIQHIFKHVWHFPDHPILAQVATVGDGGPNIRTQRLFDMRGGELLFSTTTHAAKYRELQQDGRMAALFLDPEWEYQLVAKGRVEFGTDRSIWEMIRSDVKLIYTEHPEPEPPETYVSMHLLPHTWEYFKLTPHHPDSIKELYTWENGAWKQETLPLT